MCMQLGVGSVAGLRTSARISSGMSSKHDAQGRTFSPSPFYTSRSFCRFEGEEGILVRIHPHSQAGVRVTYVPKHSRARTGPIHRLQSKPSTRVGVSTTSFTPVSGMFGLRILCSGHPNVFLGRLIKTLQRILHLIHCSQASSQVFLNIF